MQKNSQNPVPTDRAFTRYTILALTIMILLPSSIPNARAETTVLIGKIVDSDGNPLSKVNISIYDTTIISGTLPGALKETSTSASDGEFRIYVDSGDRIVLSKLGYLTKSLDFISSLANDVDLGTIILEKGLVIVSASQNRVVDPSTNLSISLELDNRGEVTEACKISIFHPQGWEVKLTDEVGEFNQITLPSGSTKRFSLEIYIPITASGVNNITLSVYGYTNVTWATVLEVKNPEFTFLKCEYPSKVAYAGDLVRYKLNLMNRMNVEGRFQLSLIDLPSEWQGRILNLDGEQINEISLETGSNREFIVEANIPDSILSFSIPQGILNISYHFSIAVESRGLKDELDLVAIVEVSNKVLNLWTRYPSQSIQLGKTVTYEVSIANPSNFNEVLSLSTKDLPTNWSLSFKNKDGVEIQQVSIPGKGSEPLDVEITPAAATPLGNYTITILANSQNAGGDLTLVVYLTSYYSMKVSVSSLYEEMKVGDEKTLNVQIANNGFSVLSDLTLSIESTSTTLQVDKDPLKVAVLKPGDSQMFQLNVRASEGTAPGDYILKIGAQSKELSVSRDENIIRLAVSQSSNITTIVILMVIISIGGIVFVMMKFRRR